MGKTILRIIELSRKSKHSSALLTSDNALTVTTSKPKNCSPNNNCVESVVPYSATLLRSCFILIRDKSLSLKTIIRIFNSSRHRLLNNGKEG